MTKPDKVCGLDIGQDMVFQRLEWRVQSIAWIVISALLVAALLGLLGRGPLSKAHAGDVAGVLHAAYQRIERRQAPTRLIITTGRHTAQDDKLRLTLNRAFLDRIAVDDIHPQPDGVEAAGDHEVFVFTVADPAQPIEVMFVYQFILSGNATVKLGIENGPVLTFNQFVFP